MALAFFSHAADFITDSVTNPPSQRPFLAVAGASLTLGLALGAIWASEKSHPSKIIPSPLKAIQSSALNSNEKKDAPVIPLDVLPGARDVSTPYGSIRVYEWGPEDGRKVLLVHGISTPCLSLGGLAHALVDRGCRVMLFDLFGRGYSDYPSDIPQDERLFSTQVLLALTSSPLSWTGASCGKFSLIGYSLGGGVAAAFASHFPNLLSSLILLAPAGLIQDSHFSWHTRILHAKGWFPEDIISSLVKARLKAGPLVKPKKHKNTQADSQSETVGIEDALSEGFGASPQQVLSRAYPSLTIPACVSWQAENHPGFVPAFISSIRHAPLRRETQFENWKRLGSILSENKNENNDTGLSLNKVLIVLGETDNIIFKNETVEDATVALEGHARFSYFSIGHEFPSVVYEELATQIVEFWK